jgi:putative oxidoreductase
LSKGGSAPHNEAAGALERHMNLSADSSRRWQPVVTWVLRVLLAVAFLYTGATKFTGTANTVPYFDAIGWGQWFRYATGFLDVAGAVLILVPRLTFYGAIILLVSVGTATLLSFTVLAGNPAWGAPVMKLVPLALTLLAVALAWLTAPPRVSAPADTLR